MGKAALTKNLATSERLSNSRGKGEDKQINHYSSAFFFLLTRSKQSNSAINAQELDAEWAEDAQDLCTEQPAQQK